MRLVLHAPLSGNISNEIKTIYAKLKAKVEECPNFYPDMPGAPRRGNYGTFYDFAEPNNPF